MPIKDIPSTTRIFLSRYIRSVEQLEILLLFGRDAEVSWTAQQVYDVILSTPASVERWLNDLWGHGLLEKDAAPSFRCSRDPALISEIASLATTYHTSSVRVIEAIYRRETTAAQSFADAFKFKTTDHRS